MLMIVRFWNAVVAIIYIALVARIFTWEVEGHSKLLSLLVHSLPIIVYAGTGAFTFSRHKTPTYYSVLIVNALAALILVFSTIMLIAQGSGLIGGNPLRLIVLGLHLPLPIINFVFLIRFRDLVTFHLSPSP